MFVSSGWSGKRQPLYIHLSRAFTPFRCIQLSKESCAVSPQPRNTTLFLSRLAAADMAPTNLSSRAPRPGVAESRGIQNGAYIHLQAAGFDAFTTQTIKDREENRTRCANRYGNSRQPRNRKKRRITRNFGKKPLPALPHSLPHIFHIGIVTLEGNSLLRQQVLTNTTRASKQAACCTFFLAAAIPQPENQISEISYLFVFMPTFFLSRTYSTAGMRTWPS